MIDESRPVYLRLRDEIAAAILDGRYGDGEILPSVRAFAAQQGANPLTVAKAYQSFQDDGLVQVRRGVGMFVTPGASRRLRAMERERFFSSVWPGIAQQMHRIGITLEELADRNDVPVA
ncbi:MAG: GntR family transcriptional regulator [Alphaproteobacteria bacterium]|nr:GntR family transcriptional regulator [Alphaproteobacteria bacterium]MBU0794851.1 GntR family transcriptional regulator [Alphaproteobacteria bacterium]MBU0874621.1 GntR family transcriptional regulator [Alphaproteobacteria bacterium]MBU1768043.1 GntR family transcriptional regulator [Alphaproteobacteria bacterium]